MRARHLTGLTFCASTADRFRLYRYDGANAIMPVRHHQHFACLAADEIIHPRPASGSHSLLALPFFLPSAVEVPCGGFSILGLGVALFRRAAIAITAQSTLYIHPFYPSTVHFTSPYILSSSPKPTALVCRALLQYWSVELSKCRSPLQTPPHTRADTVQHST